MNRTSSVTAPVSSLRAALRSGLRGGVVGAWHAWRLALVEARIATVETWMAREREVHQDQLQCLRHELNALHDARIVATQQAAQYWRAVR